MPLRLDLRESRTWNVADLKLRQNKSLVLQFVNLDFETAANSKVFAGRQRRALASRIDQFDSTGQTLAVHAIVKKAANSSPSGLRI